MKLPTGYYWRREGLALNVKVHRSPTGDELHEVAEELGADAADFAAWLEREQRGDCRLLAELDGFAAEDAFEQAEERARELLGAGVKVHSAGRSGGWLVLTGPGLAPGAVVEAVELALQDEDGDAAHGPKCARRMVGSAECTCAVGDAQYARGGAVDLLAALETFREECEAAVADHPRRRAWHYCANGYLPWREERDEAERREAARARLERATAALAEAVRAVTLHGERSPKPFSVTVDDLLPALAEYDEARADEDEPTDLEGRLERALGLQPGTLERYPSPACSVCDEVAPLRDSGVCGACENDAEARRG